MSTHSVSVFRRITASAIAVASIGLISVATASSDQTRTDHPEQAGGEGHAHHARMMERKGYERTEHDYVVPDVVLTNQDNEPVMLRAALSGAKPVILNFIFTTCTTICPVLSASLAQTQRALGSQAKNVRMISISIDPDYDGPAKLREYASRFHAAEGWQFLTGKRQDILKVLRAFDAYRGDKINHIPLTLLHFAPGGPWIRLEGFASADELVWEYQRHNPRAPLTQRSPSRGDGEFVMRL